MIALEDERLELTESSKRLLELLWTIPPQLEAAKDYLDSNQLSADEVTRVANVYADKCFLDFGDYFSERYPDRNLSKLEIPTGIVPELHSAYIYEVVKLLLQFGLDPNAVYATQYGHYNIMNLLFYIDHGYLAADTMVLLLEAGGDPNLVLNGESIFDQVDFDIFFGAIEQDIRWRYDAWVHMWFVLLGYGGTAKENDLPVRVFKEYETNEIFDLKKLRNHRDFYYGLSVEEKEAMIHIYDKRTFWEVARW